MPYNNFLEQLRQKRIERGPVHHFENLKDSERLNYELLTPDNYQHIVELFSDDDSEFIDYGFKYCHPKKRQLAMVSRPTASSFKLTPLSFLAVMACIK